MKNYFTLSEHPNMNYVATICSINELYPIENSDHLLRTVVNGFDIVVDKSTKIGDIVVYFPVESAISLEFLGKNNLFGVDAYILNDNKEIVKELLEQSQIALDNGDNDLYVQKKNDAKALCGFFNDKGRVKTITLRGCPSQGFITPVKSLCNWKPTLNTITDWSKFINTVFDTVDGDLLVKKYVRIIPETNVNKSNNRSKKRNKNLKKFDRLYEDQFAYHYDTNMLNTNMFKFNPEDVVTITKKIHGCVDGSTIIDTQEYGKLTIKEIVDNKIKCNIKCLNTITNEICYCEIGDYYFMPNDGEWYEIELENGMKLKITGNNPVWLPELNCYRKVEDLNGDEFLLID